MKTSPIAWPRMTRFRGDTKRLPFSLTDEKGIAIDPTGCVMLFTLKDDGSKPDTASLVQKISTTGGFYIIDAASGSIEVEMVPSDDDQLVVGAVYQVDVQVQLASGAVKTGGRATLVLSQDVSIGTSLSISTTVINPPGTSVLTLPTIAGHALSILRVNAGETALEWSSAGSGSVTSVALSLPNIFSVTGTPITAAGTLTAALATQAANLVFAGPTTGAAAAPTFRSLGLTDIPLVGSANGLATLDGGGKLTSSQLPDLAVTDYLGSVASQVAMLALTGQRGDWCNRSDLGTVFIITGSDPTQISSWTQLNYPTAPVTSVAGRTGAITLTQADISGLTTASSPTLTGLTLSGATANTIAYFNGSKALSSGALQSNITLTTGTLSLASALTSITSVTGNNAAVLTLGGATAQLLAVQAAVSDTRIPWQVNLANQTNGSGGAGAARGPFISAVYDTPFSGSGSTYYDAALVIGYNSDIGGGNIVNAEPSFHWGLEQDYFDGTNHLIENYWEYRDGSGISPRKQNRPIFMQIRRDTGVMTSFELRSNGISFTDWNDISNTVFASLANTGLTLRGMATQSVNTKIDIVAQNSKSPEIAMEGTGQALITGSNAGLKIVSGTTASQALTLQTTNGSGTATDALILSAAGDATVTRNLVIAGTATGITSLTMSGALSGATTGTFSSTNTSNSPTTGAVIIGNGTAGGLGVGGDIYAHGVVASANGTAGAPGFTFSSANSIGFYNSSDVLIGIAIGGSRTAMWGAGGTLYGASVAQNLVMGAAGAFVFNPAAGQNLTVNTDATGFVSIAGTKASTSTSTGALVVSGGMGVAGSAYIGSQLRLSSDYTGNNNVFGLYAANGTTVYGLLGVSSGGGTLSTSAAAQDVVLRSQATLRLTSGGATDRVVIASSDGGMTVTCTTASTSTTTGGGIFSGGLGVAGAIWGGSTGNFAGDFTLSGTVGTSGHGYLVGPSAAGKELRLQVGNSTGFITFKDNTGADMGFFTNSSKLFTLAANLTVSGGAATLGVAGSVVGSAIFNNATSGSITLQPVTGALGSSALSLPAATDTLVGRATTDTMSNKTLVAPALGTPASGVLTNCTGTAKSVVAGNVPYDAYQLFGVF